MPPSNIRQKLIRGETVVCAKAGYQDPEILELMGSFGFDGIWICLEHRRLDPLMVNHMIRACRLGGIDAVVRTKPGNYADVAWLLDAGAAGLMLPRVVAEDEVREVIAAMKFPPAGRRGLDGIQAEACFGRIPTADYVATANDHNFLAVQIEEPAVVPHIEAIAALPGVDVLFVGPADLTLGLGKPGRVDDHEVASILQQVVAACQRHGKVAGLPCAADQVGRFRSMGFQFFNVISDYRCLMNGLADVQAKLAAAGLRLPNRLP
jgi:2-keto-3-deoxy-L-rhamnonate aldolase RhmA